MENVQRTASKVVGLVLTGKNLNQVLSEICATGPTLTPSERGAVQDICYGTLRYYGLLSVLLERLQNRPIQDKQIRNLLLVTLYQLQYSRAAPYAIVNHAVATARRMNRSVDGLVNAILRTFLRAQAQLIAEVQRTELGRYSYPHWWVAALRTQYGERADQILLAGNEHPPMTLRVNRKRATAEEYLRELQAAGIAATVHGPGAVTLQHPLPVAQLPGFAEGRVSVQDAGAQYAAQLLDVQDGMHVLDACAAPGGKTAHLLELADLDLLAIDKDEQRLQRITENLHRLHLSAAVVQGDAAQPAAWWQGKMFHRILADVPCSASGVVRRHPDIKWLRRPEDILSFAEQQLAIVTALWRLLLPGGKLLYATCSVFAEENQRNVDRFLQLTPDALQLSLQVAAIGNGQLLPTEQHDGFYYALLQKRA